MMMKHIFASTLLLWASMLGAVTLAGCGGNNENQQLAPVELSDEELAEERATPEAGA
ncbi:hypothetical protein [Novipirellula caenicola]|uniref:Secreted protein n=1 Tax=Novipirellula caenicola TaxID=1536901 RepID=A0ABP9VXB9_9BACT